MWDVSILTRCSSAPGYFVVWWKGFEIKDTFVSQMIGGQPNNLSVNRLISSQPMAVIDWSNRTTRPLPAMLFPQIKISQHSMFVSKKRFLSHGGGVLTELNRIHPKPCRSPYPFRYHTVAWRAVRELHFLFEAAPES